MSDDNGQVMNGLVNKLYAVFTAPDPNDSNPPKDASYISICSPGLALAPKMLNFNDLQTKQHYSAAQQFARLANSIPQAGTNWRPTGTLVWELYDRITNPNNVSLPTVDLDAKQKAILAKAQNYLRVVVTKTNPFDDSAPPTRITQDSEALVDYRKYYTKYTGALRNFNNALINANSPNADPLAVQDFARNGQILKDAVVQAFTDWESLGNKGFIEQAQGIIANLSGQGPQAAFLALRAAFASSRLQDTNGSDFYLTSPYPADVMDSEYDGSWTKFSYRSDESHAFTNTHEMHSGAAFGGGYGLFSASGSGDYHEATAHDKIDTSGFALTVELLQVPLMRPWFNFSVLQSRGWKWNSGAFNAISDGATPPTGDMPLVPQSVILARNLKISLNTSSNENTASMKSIETAVSASYGPFSVKGNFGFKDTNETHDSKLTAQGIETPGLQLIAFVCAPVPKAPNPDPSLNFAADVEKVPALA